MRKHSFLVRETEEMPAGEGHKMRDQSREPEIAMGTMCGIKGKRGKGNGGDF